MESHHSTWRAINSTGDHQLNVESININVEAINSRGYINHVGEPQLNVGASNSR